MEGNECDDNQSKIKTNSSDFNHTIINPVSTRAASRKARVYVLYNFLIHTYKEIFDNDRNCTGKSFILDVAGGKGDLSWIINNLHPSVHSTVIDPRPTNHLSLKKSIQFLKENPSIAQQRSIVGLESYQPLAALSSEFPHDMNKIKAAGSLRLYLNDDLVQNVQNFLRDDALCDTCAGWNNYFLQALCSTDVQKIQPSTSEEGEIQMVSSNHRVTSPSKAIQIITKSQLIVGFHPDQATEAIIDLAILLKVPFCIVPCCVFPSEFPNRMLHKYDSCGNILESIKVKDYSTFIEYLRGKHPKIRMEKLGFHFTSTAKNIVLYTLPEDMVTSQ